MPFSAKLNAKAQYNINKLQKRLRGHVGKAIADFNMIEEGDKVMVCLSGGKDSYVMLNILMSLQAHAPIHFDIIVVSLDQKLPGHPEHILPDYLDRLGVEYLIVEEDTYAIVQDKIEDGKAPCSLCSRLRRGILYRTASELNATKVALGHHREDILETLFLNMFHGGKLKTMPAKLVTDDGKHVVIRPLAYCKEKDIVRLSDHHQFPIIPDNLCGLKKNQEREMIKGMLNEWDKRFPGRLESMFRAVSHAVPSHLMDHQLYDFKNLKSEQTAENTEENIEIRNL